MFRSVLLGGLALASLSSGLAFAADIAGPPPAAVAPAPASVDWTGFYIGVFGGVAGSDHSFTIDPSTGSSLGSLDTTGKGFTGGARVGYDAQMSGVLLGAFADISDANIGTAATLTIPSGPATLAANSTLNWVGTIQGKLGVPVSDSLLIYAHGGWAYGHSSQSGSISGLGVGSVNANENRSGFVIGAGLQYALSANLSINTEYSYFNLGKATITTFPIGGGNTAALNEQLSYSAITAGISYKF
jgi:outer membrane immunogenic protein